ncbi:hypothetical protein B9L21_14995 [Geobacillus uzenensis]|uniref:Uncharacterized protein n=1 Tax=Geobacillus uzenensis TaxID=129339 RepID=A0ABX4DF40_9BACL|nr:hypothetical protein B9L21_14995 [Geobacillus uzenensis]
MAAEARQYEKLRPLDTFGVGAEAYKANQLSIGEFDPGSGRTLKSGSAAIGSRSQMFFTRRGACTPRGKVIWQKRARRWS